MRQHRSLNPIDRGKHSPSLYRLYLCVSSAGAVFHYMRADPANALVKEGEA